MSPSDDPWVSTKNVIPFGLAVLPAIGNVYTNVFFYIIEDYVVQVYSKDGPPLPLGEQLCGGTEPEVLCFVYFLYRTNLIP